MPSRAVFYPTVLLVVLSSVASSCSGAKNTPGAGPRTDGIELTQSGACGDAFFWAATLAGDVAVTITVKARGRSHDDPTTIPIDLPDSTVKARVLRGRDMTDNFCNDVIDKDKSPTSSRMPSPVTE